VSEEEIEREWNEFINRQRSQQFLREKNIILRRIKISLNENERYSLNIHLRFS